MNKYKAITSALSVDGRSRERLAAYIASGTVLTPCSYGPLRIPSEALAECFYGKISK